MTFSGNLEGIGLADVFQNISANMVTGTLHVRWRHGERFVRFERGQVAGFSLGVGKGLPIIEHIRQRAYLPESNLESLRKKRKRSRKSPGRLLVEMGLLKEDEMRGIFAEAVEENVHDLMALKEAQFSFTEGDPPARVFDLDQRDMQLRMEPGPMLIEGARRKDEWERIQRVIGSDRDLFVVLEGWEQVELDPVGQEVAELLDGRTDIRTVLKHVRGSRFDVMKAVSDLVLQGLARRCTGDEIQHMVQDALAEGNTDDAVDLLTQALAVERSSTDLRQQLAELHEELNRPQEAAAEYASLGYQAAQEDRLDDALAFYTQAADLNPGDLVLRERRVELLVRAKDGEALEDAVLDLVELMLDMGLADRARTALQSALDSRLLPDEIRATERLAGVESSVGNGDVAADLYLHLAGVLKKEEARALEYMRRALMERPHDQALAARIEDIQTGRELKRRMRRRRLVASAVVVSVVIAVGLAGAMEITAAHQVQRALATGLGPLEDGGAVAGLRDLQEVSDQFAWTLSGRRAGEHADRLVELHLQTVERLLVEGEHDQAAALLDGLLSVVSRPDFLQRAKALQKRLDLERGAAARLDEVEDRGAEATEALAALEGELADGNLLDFYLARLPQLKSTRARLAVLRILEQMNQPRVLATVALLFLRERDPEALALMHKILAQADSHRIHGREGEWEAVYPELERARHNPETRRQAERVLARLKGTDRR